MLFKIFKFTLFIFVIFFTLFIYSSSNNVRMWADDFCTATILKQYGFWEAQKFSWLTWSGRYSYNFFIYFFLLFGSEIVKHLPIIILGSLILSVYMVTNNFIITKSKIQSFLISALFVILVLVNTPNIIQSFYWYGGSLIYLFPFVLINIAVFLMFLKNKKANKRRSTAWLFLIFVLIFITGGFSESLTAAILVELLVVLTVYLVIYRKININLLNSLIFGIVGLVVSLLVMYKAPGTTIRSALLDKPGNLWWVFTTSLIETKDLLNHLFEQRAFQYSLILIPATVFLIVKLNSKNIKLNINPVKILWLLLLNIFIAITPTISLNAVAYYTMAYHPPERSLIIAVYFIITALFLSSFVVSVYLINNIGKKISKSINLGVFIFFLAVLTLLGRDTYRRWSFIKNDLQTYADAWDKEEIVIKEQKITGRAEIRYIPPVGRIDGFKDNKGWVLGCVRGFYEVKDIVVE